MPPNVRPALAAVAALTLGVGPPAAAQTHGVLGKPAPAWRVDQWINLPSGAERLDVADLKGEVVYLYCFQSWCPGCHSSGFPTLQALIERYDGADDVAFVAVQTTFEGFHANTAERAWATAERYGLTIPIGHSGADGRRSRLMTDYRTGGTPWTVVIDKSGTVRFNDFHTTPDAAAQLIDRLRAEPTPPDNGGVPVLPAERGGQDLIGAAPEGLAFDRWARGGPPDDAAPVTIYRWWTDGCPHCAASLPALERLRGKYARRGLRVVGVYHPKPPRPTSDASVAAAADAVGFGGDLAVDVDWGVLRRVYLDRGERPATSVTIVVDAAGFVRFVHPGPRVHPSRDPAHEQAADDYDLLERAVLAIMREDAAAERAGGRSAGQPGRR